MRPLLLVLCAAACSSGASADPADPVPRPALSDDALADKAVALARLEKTRLTLGFIKLTDCAPLVIAVEQGYFEDEGLTVTLEAQANWKILFDRVLSGELDGAHMLAGQPLGAAVGIGTRADVVTAYSMDRNGNGITVSTEVWRQMQAAEPGLRAEHARYPISATALAPVVDAYKARGTPLQLGVVFPTSPHNYELRYWLAAAGIQPGFYTANDTRGVTDADVLLSVTPPPQMPATLEAGTLQGYCVGEPWNQQAVLKGIGVAVATDADVWRDNPEKVFGVTREWAEHNPHTHVALIKALMRAGRWLDESPAHRIEAADILSRRDYVGADEQVIASSMTGTFLTRPGDRRELPDFNVFYRGQATYPFYSDAVWYLTQMRRWGQIGEPHPDGWYDQVARRVYRPDVYLAAARALLAEGRIDEREVPWDSDGYRPPTREFIDHVEYDGRQPNDYLDRLRIGIKDGSPAGARP
ncbi:MAG TPA: CmpA/NrtA family ABC transporter substrate-binding protein [Kofleriaceae bacterium]|nr:CmpA/NrtA family ABC transporter substrate-binding protein [Kofleriaceae bacterium]